MAEINGELDSLNRWNVEDLKIFCRRHGLPIATKTYNGHHQKRKEELTALPYSKSMQFVGQLVLLTNEDEIDAVKHDCESETFGIPWRLNTDS